MSFATVHLIISIVAVLQGLLTLIGGMVAAYDSGDNSLPSSKVFRSETMCGPAVLSDPNKQPEDIFASNACYHCGLLTYYSTSPGCSSLRSNDRGWFRRLYVGFSDETPASLTDPFSRQKIVFGDSFDFTWGALTTLAKRLDPPSSML